MATSERITVEQALEAAKGHRPRSPQALWNFIKVFYGLAVPRKRICPDHDAPFDYVTASVLADAPAFANLSAGASAEEEASAGKPRIRLRQDYGGQATRDVYPERMRGARRTTSGDLVVWACRGGGKTELGSVTTHLDSIFLSGCQTRILGGSLEQSEKMYRYLSQKWHPHFEHLLASEPTKRRTVLTSGAAVEVLTQSPRSVRGQRVHRLKCDELDEFDPDVWQAAQFVTQSSRGIRAHLEVFSTLHRPWGLMQKVVDEVVGEASSKGDAGWSDLSSSVTPAQAGVHSSQAERLDSRLRGNDGIVGSGDSACGARLFKWCLWEVVERCGPERSCSRCPLWPDCAGRAKEADGYLQIDDAIAQMRRSSAAAWQTEMLCQRPRSEDLVFSEFSPALHVSDVSYDAGLPLYRAVDFGYANPFVCLWMQMKTEDRGQKTEVGLQTSDIRPQALQVRVIAEYVERRRTIREHLDALRRLDLGPVVCTFADPAGWARNDVTGSGPCQELVTLGERVRTRRSGILEGVEIIRRLLAPAARVPGEGTGLVIDRRCTSLLRALETYHFRPVGEAWQDVPEKDGTSDHPIDALRYGLVNLLGRSTQPLKEKTWW